MGLNWFKVIGQGAKKNFRQQYSKPKERKFIEYATFLNYVTLIL